MSKSFIDWESLREKYLKEVISDLKTFTNKGCKIAAQKKLVFGKNFLCGQDFFGIGATIHIGGEILCVPYARFVKMI